MDARKILDQILGSGRELADKSMDFAGKQLGIPESGPSRDAAMANLGKGALAGGLLALLLGTKSGRSVTGKAIKYGSIAAVAAVAYKTFLAWQENQTQAPTMAPPPLPTGKPLTDASESEAQHRSLWLLRAMIAAANADGHIDAEERNRIQTHLANLDLGPETHQLIAAELRTPASIEQIAGAAASGASASEIYLLSSLVIDDQNPMESSYLQSLASALKLPDELVERLKAASTI